MNKLLLSILLWLIILTISSVTLTVSLLMEDVEVNDCDSYNQTLEIF